jgi:hypothetical protein
MPRLGLVAAVLVGLALTASDAPAQGLGIFRRRQKSDPPASKVKQHIATLQTSTDGAKRKEAAVELRQFDPRSNTDVIPALMGALQKDPVPAVRSAAAESIGALKPVSQPAGLTLEAVAQADPDPGVREAAKQALWQYHLNGYRTPVGSPLAAQTAEPPFAAKPASRPGLAPPPVPGGFRPITNAVGKGQFFPQTAEPPLAKPKGKEPAKVPTVLPPPQPAANVPQPMPPTAPATPPPAAPTVPTGPLPPISIPQAPPPPAGGK